MAYDKLKKALLSVDWNANVKAFLDDEISLPQKMALRINQLLIRLAKGSIVRSRRFIAYGCVSQNIK